MTINTKTRKLIDDESGDELVDIADSFTPQKVEFIKAGGSYAIVFGKKLQTFACETLGVELDLPLRRQKKSAMQGRV